MSDIIRNYTVCKITASTIELTEKAIIIIKLIVIITKTSKKFKEYLFVLPYLKYNSKFIAL